ncbi:MAG TPA: diguanylate cyclase [Mycobacteriales bacterium]|nr:diguanylate cyclase [Mycobacteriales bacterium]
MRILVVDDDPVSRRIVEAALEQAGHTCDSVAAGQAAWDRFAVDPYDVVITDRNMPGVGGIELVRRIREHVSGRRAYVVLLTAHDSPDEAVEGVTVGADDYLTKPLNPRLLQLRLLAAERLTDLHTELDRMRVSLEEAARTDPLTGLGNRLALHDDLERLHSRVQRYGHSYCVAVIDIDHFKPYNDTYGHQAGDAALRSVAGVLAAVRAGDRAYRYGGEEFVLVLPEQTLDQARAAVERVRARVRELAIPHALNEAGVVTLSAGVARLRQGDGQEVDALIAAADRALYEAKASGRNRVVTAREC